MALPPPPPPPPPPMAQSPVSQARLEEGLRPGEPPNQEISGVVVCMNVINTITQILLGAVAFSAFFFINLVSFTTEFKAHVCLSVIGYVLLMSQAVLSFNPYTGWANNLKYPQKRAVHWILQVMGSILAISGGALGITSVSSDNLQSTHGIVGFVAMLLTVMSFVGGMVNLVCPEKMNNLLLKTLHACVGCLTLTVAYVALCLGFDLSRSVFGDVNANLSISLAVFALLGTLLMAFANMARRANISTK